MLQRWLLSALLLLPLAFSFTASSMATVNEVTAANRYSGNGSTTVFSYGFKILANTDIEVVVDSTVKVLTTDYTVSGVGVSGGGSVTFLTAPASGTVVTLLRKQPAAQSSTYTTNEAFSSERVEKDYDKLVMQMQQAKELASRSYHVPATEPGTAVIATVPSLALRANKYAGWNASGEPTALDPTSASGTSVTATGATTAILLADRFAAQIDVKDEGAIGNGVADDRQAFVDADADTAGPITCSEGTYLINSNLTITSPVIFRGCILKPASGVTVTLSGGVIADDQLQIFDTTVSATSYAAVTTQTVSPNWWGVKSAGSTDSLAAWNQVVKHLNANNLESVRFPPGKPEFSAAPDALTAGPFTIAGAGGAATILVMQAGAGTAGTFFTLGSASLSVSRAAIRDFSFQYNNYASLDGTKNPFNLIQTFDTEISHIIIGREDGNGGPGFITLGSNSLAVQTQRTVMHDISLLMYGPAEGTAFDVQRSNVNRVSTVTVGTTASVTGALKGIHMHPTGGTNTIDSGVWQAVEINLPGDNVDYILVLDASQGIVVNQWFSDCVFDHADIAGIRLLVSAGAHASARMDNIAFTNVHARADTLGAVLIENAGTRDMTNISFKGGELTGKAASPVKITGTGSAMIDAEFLVVHFDDTDNTTAKSAIEAEKLISLRVIGSSATAQQLGNTNTFQYLVKFTGDVGNFVITDNDCRTCSLGVVDNAALTTTNSEATILQNNVGPVVNYTKAATTTDATVTNLLQIAMLDATTCQVSMVFSGVQSGGTNRASYERIGTFYRTGGGGATLQGAVTAVHTAESNAAWDVTLDTNGNNIRGRVTGVAATTIKWGGSVKEFVCQRE
mgnify:CR=1 FL=1